VNLAHWMIGWLLGMMALTLIWGCDIPTEYSVRSPECPWPPPMVTDSTVVSIPLGCPYRDKNGETVDPWWPQ
jgi:hypothetical protein